MRRKELQASEAFAYTVADQCDYAVVAMTGPDGAPYCVPVSPVRIGTALYFHGAAQGKKADLLRLDRRVCITCVCDVQRVEEKFTASFRSAMFFGEAVAVTDPAEKRRALYALCQRYAPGNQAAFDRAVDRGLAATAIWRVEPREVTGKQKQFDETGRPIFPGRK